MQGKVKVFLERQNKEETIELDGKAKATFTVADIMKQLNVNPAEVIAVRNDELVTEDAKVKAGDELKFLAVISGG